jgi:hypothetical protein
MYVSSTTAAGQCNSRATRDDGKSFRPARSKEAQDAPPDLVPDLLSSEDWSWIRDESSACDRSMARSLGIETSDHVAYRVARRLLWGGAGSCSASRKESAMGPWFNGGTDLSGYTISDRRYRRSTVILGETPGGRL